MPVDSRHPSYNDNADRWGKIRHALAGEDAVKSAGTTYLPKLEGQEENGYQAYLKRADFYEASSRTLDGLSGAIFRKEPKTEVPDGVDLATITRDGLPWEPFAKTSTREVIAMGRYGLLVDAPSNDGGAPYIAGYRAEDIVNWRVEPDENNVPRLIMVVLREMSEGPDPEDRYETVAIERYRVLTLEEGGYVQRVFKRVDAKGEKAGKGDFVQEGEDILPTRRGLRLDFIPFIFVGPFDLTADVQQSPLLPLVNKNFSHYRTSADLEHGAHFTALPTVVLIGDLVGQDEKAGSPQLAIGSGVAWNLRGEKADAKMLEYTGQGLEALEKRLERKEKHMAVLGARMLEDQKVAVEAMGTVKMRHRGENSLLASIADTNGRGLGLALSWVVWWAGSTTEIDNEAATVELNKDFVESPLTPKEMVELSLAWQQGVVGAEAVFHALKQGESLPDDWKFEDWQKDIEENGAGVGAFMGPMSGMNENDPGDDPEGEGEMEG